MTTVIDWDTFIRFGINLGVNKMKKTPIFPKNWQKITKSKKITQDNFAILTGKINDIIVIDIDTKHDMPGLEWFIKHFGPLDTVGTLVTKSWSGGYHIFFRYSPLVKSTAWNDLCIDIQSDGKCIFQGKNYDILHDNNIRELTGDELAIFSQTSFRLPLQKQVNESNKNDKIKNTTLTDFERKILLDFVIEKYKFYENEVRDILVDTHSKSIIVALDSTKCPFIQGCHKSNHQYIVFNVKGAKQRCHDADCKDKIYGDKRLPKEITQILTTYVPTDANEEKDIIIAEEECKKFIMNEYKDHSSMITYDRENGHFSGISESIHSFFTGTCNPCDIQYVIDNNGQYLFCNKCKTRFPNSTQMVIPKEAYPNIHQVLVNFTINNNYASNEFDETLDYNIDKDIFDDQHIWYLVNESLNGCKSDQIAELLKEFTDDFVYDCKTEKGTWYYFDGSKWMKDEDHVIMFQNIKQLFKEYFSKVKDYYRTTKTEPNIIKCINNFHNKLSRPALKKEILEEARQNYINYDFYKRINTRYHLLPFSNGVYDFFHKKFRKCTKDDFIELNLGYNYDTKVYNKDVWKFICEILPQENIRDYVLKCFSNSLNGRNSNEEMLLLIGSGSNGKTQLLNLVLNTFGEFGEKLAPTLITKPRKDASDANPELAKLMHKRFAFISEPEHGQMFNIAQLKELTGNEKIVARRLYREPVTFPMICHFYLACNKLPNLPTDLDPDDESLTRRIRVIDFTSHFVSNPVKPNEFKINKEIPIILEDDITWRQTMMNILLGYVDKEVSIPDQVLLRTQEYKTENNEYIDWIRENIVVKEGYKINLKEICDSFKLGMKQNEKTLMKRYIEKNFGIECIRIKIQGKTGLGFFGLDLVV
jgi:P4 family phage/plasmid primase-like protien